MYPSQHPTRRKCGGSPHVVLKRVWPIQPDNDEDTSNSQKTLKTVEGRSQREMVQRRNDSYEIETVVEERASHHVTLYKVNARVRETGSSSAGDGAIVGINRDNLFTVLSKPPSEQAGTTTNIESTPRTRRNRTQHEIVVVNIVVPRPRVHALLFLPTNRLATWLPCRRPRTDALPTQKGPAATMFAARVRW